MEDNNLETQLNNLSGSEAQDESQALDKPQENKEVLPQQPPQDTQENQELWKQTKQFEQGLWKTPDDVFNSVKYYEQKFQPLEQTIKRMGYDEPAQLEQAFKEFNEKMPIYQQNEQTINLLNALLQDEVYGSKLRGVFDEIKRQQEMQRYGIAFDELPQVIQEKVQKGEQAFQQLEEMKQQQAYQSSLQTIEAQVKQIQETAQAHGLEVDINAILTHCRDNNINPEYIYSEFLKSNLAQLMDKVKTDASFATTNQNKQNKAKAVSSSSKTTAQAASSPKDFKDLEKTLLEQI